MLSVEGDALLIVHPELLQLPGGVLRRVDAKNDGESGVAAVQSADAPHQGIVQGLVLLVGVLPVLDWLVVWRGVGVGRDFPAVASQIIMVLLGDLLLHQAQAAHDVPPDCRLQGGVDSALVVDCQHTLLGQVLAGPTDGGVVVRRAPATGSMD